MSFLRLSSEALHLELASDALGAATALRDRYRAAKPFPHLIIDEFLAPELADRLLATFPPEALATVHRRNRFQNGKRGYRPSSIGDHPSAQLLQALNGPPMIALVEALTGHAALAADPDFVGGGFHEIERGGHLSIHADFRLHPILGLARRVNLILFLNREWRDEWGGTLELWNRDLSGRSAAIEPLFNRAVIFDTDRTSFHGHPQPLACPENMRRRSIALYFYNAPGPGEQLSRDTDWRVRPHSRTRRILEMIASRHNSR